MSHDQFDVQIPVNLALRLALSLNLKQRIKPRWLVYQTKASGMANREDLICANVFWRKSSAEKKQKAVNLGIPTIGSMTFGQRRWAVIVRLPHG